MALLCIWPGCTRPVSGGRACCYRHFRMLPRSLRGWLGKSFNRAEMGISRSESQRVYGAVRSWARANPDPELPPFERGDVVRGMPGSIFRDSLRLVESCRLDSDGKKWLVMDDMGNEFGAAELELVNAEHVRGELGDA